MDDRQGREMKAFKAWQAKNLAKNSGKRHENGVEPPPFTRDWSHLAGAAFEADLRGADFRRVTARRTEFRDARLCRANFEGADLRGANFERANLFGANFEKAELLGARFRDADLREARFGDSTGLTSESFGGAKLQAAKLPPEVAKFEELDNIAEVSKYIQRMFQFLLILCGFATLTILSIKDVDLILHDGQSMTSLPVLNANITPINFSFVMPGLIFIIFLYQFIYTISLWRLLSFLPAYFPDGTPLDRRAYPMILNTFVRYHLVNVTNESFDRFQCDLRGLIAFGVPPMTLVVFWISCLRLHDGMLSGFHSLLIGVSLGLLIFIFHFSRAILRNEWRMETLKIGSLRGMFGSISGVGVSLALIPTFGFIPGSLVLVVSILILIWLQKLFLDNLTRYRFVFSLAHLACSTALVSVLIWTLSVNCFESKNHSLKQISLGNGLTYPLNQEDSFSKTLGFVRLLSWFQSDPFIDIRSRFVSHRPESWTGHPKTEGDELLSVAGADLEGIDLRSADAERAFLVKANLRNANLEGAYLRFANLRAADLSNAKLRYAYLRGASLRDANLQGADIEHAIFSIDANDPNQLAGANLQGAKIDDTTKFNPEHLLTYRVNNLALAFFGVDDSDGRKPPGLLGRIERGNADPAREASIKKYHEGKIKFLKDRGVPITPDAELSLGRLIDKKFVGLSMTGADLSNFDLTDSTFSCSEGNEADLSGALFIGADLTNVKFLSVNLEGADFTRAVLNETTFLCCKLEGTIFTDAKGHTVHGLDELTMSLHGLKDDAPEKPTGK